MVPVNSAGQFKFEECCQHCGRICLAPAHQIVNLGWLGSKPLKNDRSTFSDEGFWTGSVYRVRPVIVLRQTGRDRPRQAFDNLACVLDEVCAFADQRVASFCTWVQRRARDGHHLATAFGGFARGNQRARSCRRLNHYNAKSEACDHPVADGKMARGGFCARGHFGDDKAGLFDGFLQFDVFRRVIIINTTGNNCNRTSGKRAIMGSSVNATGKP
jgi:hypothetical protein